MNLALQKTIQDLCREHAIKPSHSAGQNFLVDKETLDAIIDAADIKPSDTILEIGAGFGVLTWELIQSANTVISVELDRKLVTLLKKTFSGVKNLEIIHGDIFSQWRTLQTKFRDLEFKLVANLPYNITSKVIRHFIESEPRASDIVILVQREVAERIVAAPGSMSMLSVATQFYGQPEIIKEVTRDKFWPEPNVDSAILKIGSIGLDRDRYSQSLDADISADEFFSIVKIGFSSRRKQLHNNLSSGLHLSAEDVQGALKKAGINPLERAQNVPITSWITLVNTLRKIRSLYLT